MMILMIERTLFWARFDDVANALQINIYEAVGFHVGSGIPSPQDGRIRDTWVIAGMTIQHLAVTRYIFPTVFIVSQWKSAPSLYHCSW